MGVHANPKMEIDSNLVTSMMVLGSAIEARDPYTGGHTWRVAQFARLLGEKLGMNESDLFVLSLGGFVHDIGKVGILDTEEGRQFDARMVDAFATLAASEMLHHIVGHSDEGRPLSSPAQCAARSSPCPTPRKTAIPSPVASLPRQLHPPLRQGSLQAAVQGQMQGGRQTGGGDVRDRADGEADTEGGEVFVVVTATPNEAATVAIRR